jgi:glutaredoxin 3
MMFTVYSKPECPFCDRAKALLTSKGLPFKVVNIDLGQDRDHHEEYIERDDFLAKFPAQRTLPLILEGDNRVGGFVELQRLLDGRAAA